MTSPIRGYWCYSFQNTFESLVSTWRVLPNLSLSKRDWALALSTWGCVGQLDWSICYSWSIGSYTARRRRLAPKVVVSSGKFVEASIVCHEGAWSYSGEEEIAWSWGHYELPQRRVGFTRGCTGWIRTSVKQIIVSPLHHLHFGLFYIPCIYSFEFELCFRSIYLGVLYLCVGTYLYW